ncbi:MAG TPA: DUF4157 domain-containing protein [Actinomycetes bacterium]|nr:DUF4157 domain-containing protein [Actinomycetes bacterium]
MAVRRFTTIPATTAKPSSASRVGVPGGVPAARVTPVSARDQLAGPGAALLQLQRSHGNRYAQRVIGASKRSAVQAKLVVGPAHDEHEREADRVAERVTRRPTDPGPQRSEGAGGPAGSLPAPLREQFESALGVDLSAVRIHTGAPAVRLSRSLGAQAFTHDSDVYFGAGRYTPGSPAGQRLLAHELTHVVQQGGAPPRRDGASPAGNAPAVQPLPRDATSGGDDGRIQRKLAWDHTDWDQARRAWGSGKGGVGVAFVTDEPDAPPASYDPVVLKTGEDAPAEVVLAANMHSFGAGGVWTLGAPGARIVDQAEGRQIKAIGQRVVAGLVGWQRNQPAVRALQIIDHADQPGTVVFEFAPGTEFEDLLTKETKHSEPKTGRIGKRRLRKDSPARLFKDRDFVVSMGRLTAVDIFMGNPDRLLRYNPGNFKINTINKTIMLIDNVQLGNKFAFKTTQIWGNRITGVQAYNAWAADSDAKLLRADDFGGLADIVIDIIKNGIQGWEQARPEDLHTINAALDKSKGWWVQGLAEGKNLLRAAATDPDRFTRGVAPDDLDEVRASFLRRMRFLFPELLRHAVED